MLNHHLSMSKPSPLILIFLVTTLLIADNATADAPTKPTFLTKICVTTLGNYTTNSTYETNLISVLSDLQDHASVDMFYNSSSGFGANTVDGQYFCRGDIDSKLCGDCIQQAAKSLFAICFPVQGGIIWYEECTLRYSNQSMVGVEAEYPRVMARSKLNATDSEKLASVLENTFDRLITESTQGTKPSLFTTGEGQLSAFESVYCLVQCSPDLSGAQCDTCLRSAYTAISTCCVSIRAQVGVFFASCQLRYNTLAAFYAVKNVPPPPPPPVTPPPLQSSNTSTKDASVMLRRGCGDDTYHVDARREDLGFINGTDGFHDIFIAY